MISNILTRGKTLNILIELLNTEELSISELMKRVGGSPTTLIKILNELAKRNIIETKISSSWPYKKQIKLTPLGRSLAKAIRSSRLDDINILKKSPAKWILALIYRAGGRFESITRLIKMVFLLKEDYKIPLDYEFYWYKYGPFSKEAILDIDMMELLGILESSIELLGIDEKTGEPINRRSLALTNKGKNMAKIIINGLSVEEMRILDDLIGKFYKKPLKELKDYVYSKYRDKYEKLA